MNKQKKKKQATPPKQKQTKTRQKKQPNKTHSLEYFFLIAKLKKKSNMSPVWFDADCCFILIYTNSKWKVVVVCIIKGVVEMKKQP